MAHKALSKSSSRGDGRVVGKLWRRIEHRPRGRLPCQALFPQALTVFMERLLSRFMIGDRLFCFATSELLSLSGRETGISAFLVLAHFRFAFTRLPSMKATQ